MSNLVADENCRSCWKSFASAFFIRWPSSYTTLFSSHAGKEKSPHKGWERTIMINSHWIRDRLC